jgi:hypothetical protein
MTLSEIIQNAYLPALAVIGVKDAPQARVMMLAIGLQESRFTARLQMDMGPAMGFWQFERGGGVKGVLNHTTSAAKARTLCTVRSVTPDPMSAWLALENDDVLAAGFARLLLLTDPRALPSVTDAQGAWDCYLHNWCPGKPHRDTWDAFHAQAVAHG